jgi:hypothetical protein
MYARQWSIIGTTGFATQAIADITNSFRLHTPAVARKHQLLLVRAQLYAPPAKPGARQSISPPS